MLQKLEYKREANLIGGTWVGADTGATLDVTDPATGETIGTVPNCGACRDAPRHRGGHGAQPAWAAQTAAERAVILHRLAALIRENQEELAMLLTAEQGKPLAEARGEVGYERGVCPVVRRGSAPHLRRHHPFALGRPADPGAEAAGRRGRRDHAVELPLLHDCTQARRSTRRRLRHRGQARVADALFGARLGSARGEGRRAGRRRQHPHRIGERDRRRATSTTQRSERYPSPAQPRSARSSSSRAQRP